MEHLQKLDKTIENYWQARKIDLTLYRGVQGSEKKLGLSAMAGRSSEQRKYAYLYTCVGNKVFIYFVRNLFEAESRTRIENDFTFRSKRP